MKRFALLFAALTLGACLQGTGSTSTDASVDGSAPSGAPIVHEAPRKLGASEPPQWGPTTMALAKSVVIATDQTAIPVSGTISVDTSALATAAKQDTGNSSLATLVTNTTSIATSAKQDTGNTSLASIKTDVDKIPSQGSAAMAASTPVTIATNDTVSAALQVALNLLTMPKATTAVTISDATDTTSFCGKGVWVGTAGDLAVKMLSDSSATTLKNVPSGTFVPGQFLRIMSTNTTASNIVCFGGTG